jgi:hypothetical protein
MQRSTFFLATILAALVSTFNLVAASGNYGPNTCLEGWVWREAVPGDDVCVTPATRSQTAYDNSQASLHRNPIFKSFCRPGYVFRNAVPNDNVCVIPATRDQAVVDNGQAANRRASLNIWLSTWNDPNLPYKTCSKGTPTAGVVVNGDHFNFNLITVGIYNLVNNASLAPPVTITGALHPPLIAGSFSVQFNIPWCAGYIKSFPSAFAQAYDHNSDRNSTWDVFYTL